jgi:hypothetical protein
MKSRRTLVILVVVIPLTAALLVYAAAHWYTLLLNSERQTNASSVEANGLRIAVRHAVDTGDRLRIAYSLEWVDLKEGETRIVFMHPFVQFRVSLIAKAAIVRTEHVQAIIDLEFVMEEASLFEGEIDIPMPAKADEGSLGLGELRTNPVAIGLKQP